MASGDIDHDGHDDLVVVFGTAGENDWEILSGSSTGLHASYHFSCDAQGYVTCDIHALQVGNFGDFNGVPYDDIAWAAYLDNGSASFTGVRIETGPVQGPGCQGLCGHYQAPFPEVPDALAVGQFDSHAEDELVAGFPNDSPHNGGEVVLCFSPGCSSQETWSQDSVGIVGGSESGDRFGASLAVGDFNGDGNDDLAVGVPGEDATYTGQGAFQLIYGDGSGLTATGNQLYGSAALQADAAYATSLAAGGFDNVDAADELAAGAPVQDYTLSGGPSVSNAGIVDVHFTGATNTIWDQGPSGLPPVEVPALDHSRAQIRQAFAHANEAALGRASGKRRPRRSGE